MGKGSGKVYVWNSSPKHKSDIYRHTSHKAIGTDLFQYFKNTCLQTVDVSLQSNATEDAQWLKPMVNKFKFNKCLLPTAEKLTDGLAHASKLNAHLIQQ